MNKIYLEKYLQKTSNAFAENRLLKIVVVTMLLVTLINTWITYSAVREEKTILLPLGTNMTFEVTALKANDSYLTHMARYIIDLFANIDQANIKGNFNELLTMVYPKEYGRLKEHFQQYAADFSRYPSIAYRTTLDDSKPIQVMGKKALLVHARKQHIVGDKLTRNEPVDYEISYCIEDGRFWLQNIKEIKEHD